MQPPKIPEPLSTILWASTQLPPEVILEAVDACPWVPDVLLWSEMGKADLEYCTYMVREGLRARGIAHGSYVGLRKLRKPAEAHLHVEQAPEAKSPKVWSWVYRKPTGDDVQDLIAVLRDNFEIDVSLFQPNIGPFALVRFQQIQSWLDSGFAFNHFVKVKCDLGRAVLESREDFLDWGIGLLEHGFGLHEDDSTGNCRTCGVPRGEVERWNEAHPEPWLRRGFRAR